MPRRSDLRHQPDIGRLGASPRVVLQLRGGDIHRAPHLLRPAALHGGAVARSRYVAVRAHGYPELLPLCGSESS